MVCLSEGLTIMSALDIFDNHALSIKYFRRKLPSRMKCNRIQGCGKKLNHSALQQTANVNMLDLVRPDHGNKDNLACV